VATVLLVIIYLAFISLGLPDALLGASWPVMQPEFGVPFGFAGLVSVVISGGTIVSSVVSSRVLRRFGTGKVTAVSVGATALALVGFSVTPSFWWLPVIAIPLGLGAGALDAGLNAYVAEHYESRHMSWLHSFWGVGALSGPLLLAGLLAGGGSWRTGYLTIGLFQAGLVVVLALSIPLWARVRSLKTEGTLPAEADHQPLFFPLKLRGVKMALVAFFFYCGIESTMGLWGGSFLNRTKGLDPAAAAGWVSAFYASITVGRMATGFVTLKVSNRDQIRAGCLVIGVGLALMVLPLPLPATLAGFVLVGLGCAPIFPCMLHETPVRFGTAQAQAVMGFQMACAYVGATALPPAFGFVAQVTSTAWMPLLLVAFAAFLAVGTERVRNLKAA
jgi:fucose permease